MLENCKHNFLQTKFRKSFEIEVAQIVKHSEKTTRKLWVNQKMLLYIIHQKWLRSPVLYKHKKWVYIKITLSYWDLEYSGASFVSISISLYEQTRLNFFANMIQYRAQAKMASTILQNFNCFDQGC